jgi:hypothetical protein
LGAGFRQLQRGRNEVDGNEVQPVVPAALRAREIALMRRIGSSGGAVAAIVGAEIAIVVATAMALAGALTWGLLAVLERQLGG